MAEANSSFTDGALPDTISIGKGISMTFLRNSTYLTRVHATGEQAFVVPPHWHAVHSEWHHVVKGKVTVTIGGVTTVIGPEDGETHVPAGVVHSMKTEPGVETIIEERTEPKDDSKELGFRNMFYTGSVPSNIVYLMYLFRHEDAFPALPGNQRWLDRAFVKFFGYYLASMFRFKRPYESLPKPHSE